MNDTATVPTRLTAETASEYDFIICLDASGSMNTPSTNPNFSGKTRWEEGAETIFGIAAGLAKFDSDGIDIVTFGGKVELIEGVQAGDVLTLLNSRSPGGSTPLAAALQLVVDKRNRTQKKTVAVVLTDGVPDDRAAARDVIVAAANSLQNDEDLTFLFVQVGNDPAAKSYLTSLDDDLQPAGAKFDIVDAMTAEEAAGYAPIDLINKAIND